MAIVNTPRLIGFKPEWSHNARGDIGAGIVQWTNAASMSHHFYFTNPTATRDGRTGFFVSYRDGYPDLYRISLDSGEITRFSSRVDINPFSPSPCVRTKRVFVSAQKSVRAISWETGEDVELCRFESGRLGNCSLNANGTLLAISVREPERCRLAVVDTATGGCTFVTQMAEIGHIQFCPIDDNLLLFSGPLMQRLWVHDRRTGQNTHLIPQSNGEWFTHESWLGNSRSIIFSHWPRGLHAINADGASHRVIADVNAWHACSNPAGTLVVCDTNHPDRGLLLIDPATGERRVLCQPGATCRGTQWVFDQPLAGAGIDVSIIRSDTPERDPAPTPSDPASTYGPQWSHPHPTFTPDGKSVVFTSDRDGWSQVFSAPVPANP